MKNNFIVVGTQRTGSSAIAERIGMHPDIACGWEWTLHVSPLRKIQVAEAALMGDFSGLRDLERNHILMALKESTRWLGYRSLFRSSDKWILSPATAPAILLDRLQAHLEWIGDRSSIRIIHIVREDNIAWLRSKHLSKAINAYTATTYPEEMKVDVSEREAIKRILAKNWLDSKLGTLRNTNPYVRVSYEQFLANPDAEIGRLVNHLDCTPLPSETNRGDMKPQSTVPAETQIRNFAALQRALEARGLLYSRL